MHDLAAFQMVNKIVDPCCFGEAHRAEFAEADIFFFSLISSSRLLVAKNGYVAVDAHPADIMHQADLRILDLNVACFTPQLQDNGADLAAAGGADWVTLGKQTAVDVDRDAPLLVGLFAPDQLLGPAGRGKAQGLVGQQLGMVKQSWTSATSIFWVPPRPWRRPP